jgi:hypothetical protein
VRAILTVVILLSASLLSACTSEGDRVYAGARGCAESISKGGVCPPQQGQGAAHARPEGAGDSARGPAQADGVRADNAPAEETRVYIDASESMKGYAAAPDNSFVKVVEALGYAMPGCKLYKYGFAGGRRPEADNGQSSFAQEIRFSQELRRPSFYDLGYNEDDVLIKHLAREDTPARSVLLTDGVYSARNTELQSEVVKAVGEWMGRGRFFGILIFKSTFDGRLYSENSRSWTEPVKAGARPFYAFIFSPTEREFRELRGQLASEVEVAGSLAFPREAVSCAIAPQDKQGLEKKDAPPRSPFYLYMYNASVFSADDRAEFSFHLRCTASDDYPVAAFRPEPELDAYTWQQGSFMKSERPPQFGHRYAEPPAAPGDAAAPSPGDAAAPSPGDAAAPSPGASPAAPASPTTTPAARSRPNLTLTLSRDAVAGYSLYHLKFDLSGRVLRPDIRNISTQDDALIGEAGKTYRFYEFISALTAMHLQDKKATAAPPPVFIAVANK